MKLTREIKDATKFLVNYKHETFLKLQGKCKFPGKPKATREMA